MSLFLLYIFMFQLNGKHGYFPKYLVQETKVFEKDLKFSVSTVEHTEVSYYIIVYVCVVNNIIAKF